MDFVHKHTRAGKNVINSFINGVPLIKPVFLFKNHQFQCLQKSGPPKYQTIATGNDPRPYCCAPPFPSFETLIQHLVNAHWANHLKDSRLTCEACLFLGENVSDARNHFRNECQLNVHSCQFCSLKYSTERGLHIHMNLSHELQVVKPRIKCNLCDKTFARKVNET